jgi:hypothetical protein
MNVDDMQFSLGFVQWLIVAIVGGYTWWVGKQSASNLELVQLRERIIEIETKLLYMPSQSEVAALSARLERVIASSEAAKEVMESAQLTLNRINDFLLHNK